MDQNALLITAIVGVVLGGIGLIGGVLGYVQSTAAVRRSTHARQRAVTAEEEALRAKAAAEATLRAAEELAERFRGSGPRMQTGPVGTTRYPVVPSTRWDAQPATGPTPAPMAEPTTGSTLLPDTGSTPLAMPVEQPAPPASAPVPDQRQQVAPPADFRRPVPPVEPPQSLESTSSEQQDVAEPEPVVVPEASAAALAPSSAPGSAPEAEDEAAPSTDPRVAVQSVQVEGVPDPIGTGPDLEQADGPTESVEQQSEPEAPEDSQPEQPAEDDAQPEQPAEGSGAADDPQDGRDSTGRVTAGVQDAPTMDWAEVLRTGAIPLPSISRGTYAAPRRRPKPTGQGPARFELRAIGRQRYEAVNVGAEAALEARVVGGGDDPHLVRPLSSRPATVAPGGALAFSVLRVEGRGASAQVLHVLNGEPVEQDLPLD